MFIYVVIDILGRIYKYSFFKILFYFSLFMLQNRKIVILRNFLVCNKKTYGTIRIRDDHNSMDDVSHELNNTIDKIEWLSEDKIAIFCNHKVYEIDKADEYVWTDENVTWTINKEDGSIPVIKINRTKFLN